MGVQPVGEPFNVIELDPRSNRPFNPMINAGAFTVDPQEAVELYFLQCSLLVTAHDLAVMSATLAAIGTNPLSGVGVFGVDAVRDALSVMFTCGLYDGAGDWACRVGLQGRWSAAQCR